MKREVLYYWVGEFEHLPPGPDRAAWFAAGEWKRVDPLLGFDEQTGTFHYPIGSPMMGLDDLYKRLVLRGYVVKRGCANIGPPDDPPSVDEIRAARA